MTINHSALLERNMGNEIDENKTEKKRRTTAKNKNIKVHVWLMIIVGFMLDFCPQKIIHSDF